MWPPLDIFWLFWGLGLLTMSSLSNRVLEFEMPMPVCTEYKLGKWSMLALHAFQVHTHQKIKILQSLVHKFSLYGCVKVLSAKNIL